MAAPRKSKTEGAPKIRLTRERVVAVALAIADAEGSSGLTMRALAGRLGVQAMSLYHHFANKDAVLDALVDEVFGEMHTPRPTRAWTSEARRTAVSAREALVRHPWALGLLDSRRAPGPKSLAHHDAMLGTLRAAGFDLPQTALAYATIDAYVYGFVQQELALPFDGPADVEGVAGELMAGMGEGQFPHLMEFIAGHALAPGYSFGAQFPVGLDLVLDALDRRLGREDGDDSEPRGGC